MHKFKVKWQWVSALGCDFVVYTAKQIGVQRIGFDGSFWKDALLPRLSAFYSNCVCPEI